MTSDQVYLVLKRDREAQAVPSLSPLAQAVPSLSPLAQAVPGLLRPTDKSDITASSELGIAGVTNINAPDTSS